MPSRYLLLGKAVKTWGLEGKVKVRAYADSPGLAASLGAIVLRGPEGNLTEYRVDSVRCDGAVWVLKLDGVDTPEEARRLIGHDVLISRTAAPPPPEGSYYHADLVGLRVVSDEGRELGRVVEIWETGANDVYVVRGEQAEWLLPATREVVRGIDLAAEIMLVRPLEGMIESEAV
ncbi:MAG: ribosome maturation factor RimM [Candidatus Methylomirabilaceae bacterium]